MNVGAHLETFCVWDKYQGQQFLCLIAHEWLSGQPLLLLEGGVDGLTMYTSQAAINVQKFRTTEGTA